MRAWPLNIEDGSILRRCRKAAVSASWGTEDALCQGIEAKPIKLGSRSTAIARHGAGMGQGRDIDADFRLPNTCTSTCVMSLKDAGKLSRPQAAAEFGFLSEQWLFEKLAVSKTYSVLIICLLRWHRWLEVLGVACMTITVRRQAGSKFQHIVLGVSPCSSQPWLRFSQIPPTASLPRKRRPPR
ncbi:hypothetical protein BR93DRAFT_328278 [Coniochaeta sp. PMI_546]|nr:hypothetical protein BR93DRAFT_328278 [Coniochaeta sp. PMI_546]